MTSIDDIRRLEEQARPLNPDPSERERLLQEAAGFAEGFLQSLPEGRACGLVGEDGGGLLDFPIAEEGMAIQDALALVDRNVCCTGINYPSPRYMGYIPGGGLYLAALGDYLTSIINRWAGLYSMSPGTIRMENLLLRWMAGLVGFPETAAGYLAPCGSVANFTAIATARDACGIEGEKVAKAVVYITEHAHHSVEKSLRLIGAGGCTVRRIPVDDAYRMDPSKLGYAVAADQRSGLNPWLVVATAGTTNTGSIDPVAEITRIAADHGLWCHVDGAYGAFFGLCPEGRNVLDGVDRADSVVLDPHKSLFLPYGSGAVLVRERRHMEAAHGFDAHYLRTVLEDREFSPAEVSLELTRRFRGLRLWLPLKVCGLAPFRAALSEKILLARHFYERLQAEDGFEVGPYPDLSIVVYRYVPKSGDADRFNELLTQELQNEGRVFVSNTRLNGQVWLRLAVLSFRTHLDEVETALDALKRKAKELEAGV